MPTAKRIVVVAMSSARVIRLKRCPRTRPAAAAIIAMVSMLSPNLQKQPARNQATAEVLFCGREAPNFSELENIGRCHLSGTPFSAAM
jgi:hypothetical protein